MTGGDLYFNGIDGVTGTYGLQPMTAEALAERIQALYDYAEAANRRHEYDRAQLGKMLERENADKIVGIVRLLADSNAQDVPRDAAWHHDWVHKLAGEIAALLPDEEVRQPAGLAGLAARLSVDTVDKTVIIVDLLARTGSWSPDRAKKLEALLLRDAQTAPEYEGLPGQLGRDFKARLDAVRQVLRRAGAGAVPPGAVAQGEWLEFFIRDLRTIPLDAFNLTLTRKVNAGLLLSRLLDGPAGAAAASQHPEDLRQALAAPTPSAGRSPTADRAPTPGPLPWNTLLDLLERHLPAYIAAEGQHLPWGDLLRLLDKWLEMMLQSTPLHVRGVAEGIDPTDIAQAGWGVIFPWEDPHAPRRMPVAEIKQALDPLLCLRRTQAGGLFRIYDKGDGCRPGETAQEFVERHRASAYNPVDPARMPYYLLVVGSPADIPFHFQYQLDVQYAVGRLDFDSLEDYACYARSVVAAETGPIDIAPAAVFFGTAHAGDLATAQSTAHLVRPLYERVKQRHGAQWRVDPIMEGDAGKDRLLELMNGQNPPAFLFAACHGVEFPKDDAQGRQLSHQGALLCQDWPGPHAGRGEIPRACYLAGEDLAAGANLGGLIAFFFACYSAGTPLFDDYYEAEYRESGRKLADRPFIAALPKAMLSRPRGGALAVVGHVERAWGTSYLGSRATAHIAHFESAVERLLNGHPIGSAMEYLNGRYAALSSELTYALRPGFDRRAPDPYELAELWTANNDARGYIVVGDPAVRLPTPPASP